VDDFRWLGVSASGRYTPLMAQWLPPLCLLAAIGGRFCLRILEKLPGRVPASRINRIDIAAFLAAPTLNQLPRIWIRPVVRTLYGNNPFPEGEMIGGIWRNAPRRRDGFRLGTEGQFLFHARRRSASRSFSLSLAAFHPAAERWQREAFAEVKAAEPRYRSRSICHRR
jgi:hypothetical protein